MIEQQIIALLKEAVSRKQAQYVAHSVRAKMLKRQLVEAVVRKNLMNEDITPAVTATGMSVGGRPTLPASGLPTRSSDYFKKIRDEINKREGQPQDPGDLARSVETLMQGYKGSLPADVTDDISFISNTEPNAPKTYSRFLKDLNFFKSVADQATADNIELQRRYEQAVQAAEQSREQGMTAQSLIDFISGPGYAQLSPEEQRRVRSAFREYVTGETRRRRERRAAARTARD